jgi:hypothetical protein
MLAHEPARIALVFLSIQAQQDFWLITLTSQVELAKQANLCEPVSNKAWFVSQPYPSLFTTSRII